MAATVNVCICTCQRPRGLARLLRGLHRVGRYSGPEVRIETYVTDNCGGAASNPAVRQQLERAPFPVHWVEATEGNIPHCRNHLIQQAAGSAEYLAFIDDDEVPSRAWLDDLLTVAEKREADAVFGPVVARFTGDAPSWVRQGGFFTSDHPDRITTAGTGATNNALVRTRVFRELDCWFDEGFDDCGGSDHELFRRLASKGYRLVAAPNGAVYERVPPARTTVRYVLHSSFSDATTAGFVDKLHNPSLCSRVRHRLRATAKALGFPLYTAYRGLVDGYPGLIRGLEVGVSGLGFLFGSLGYSWREYADQVGLRRLRPECGSRS